MRCIILPEPCCPWLSEKTEIALSPAAADAFPLTAPASPFVVIPAEDEKILQNLENLLAELHKSEAALTPPESPVCCSDDDVASALLQSLIEGDHFTDSSNHSGFFPEEQVADFNLDFIEAPLPPSAKAPPRRKRAAKPTPYSPSGTSADESMEGSPKRGPRRKLPPEDRKLRKKEQNKSAATRYRMKKKAELEELTIQENQLLEQQGLLQKQHDDLANELHYLKKLMHEAGILQL